MSKRLKKTGHVEQPMEPAATQLSAEPADELKTTTEGKNPAAVALGRLGGKKGGAARAKKLTAKQRSEIAKKAAMARWRNRDQSSSSSSGGASE